jgi:hypothetical protein
MTEPSPASAEETASLTTQREASRKKHLPYEIRHIDEVD